MMESESSQILVVYRQNNIERYFYIAIVYCNITQYANKITFFQSSVIVKSKYMNIFLHS